MPTTTTTTTAPHPRLAAYRRKVTQLCWDHRWARERLAEMVYENMKYRGFGFREVLYDPATIEAQRDTMRRIEAEARQLQGWIDRLA